MSATRVPSKSLRRAQDNAFWAHVAFADIIERDAQIAKLDAEAREILGDGRRVPTAAEQNRLDAITREHNRRVAVLRLDVLAIDGLSHRMAEHALGESDERTVASVIAAAGGAR